MVDEMDEMDEFKQGDKVAFSYKRIFADTVVEITQIGEVQGGASAYVDPCSKCDHALSGGERTRVVHIQPHKRETAASYINRTFGAEDGNGNKSGTESEIEYEYRPRYFKGRAYIVYLPDGNHPILGTDKGHLAVVVGATALRHIKEGETTRAEVQGVPVAPERLHGLRSVGGHMAVELDNSKSGVNSGVRGWFKRWFK